MYKVLFASLVAGKSPSSAGDGEVPTWWRESTLNPATKQILPRTCAGLRPAQGSAQLSPEPPAPGGRPAAPALLTWQLVELLC